MPKKTKNISLLSSTILLGPMQNFANCTPKVNNLALSELKPKFMSEDYAPIYIDYLIESAPYGFLFTGCKTLENERVSAANE